VDIKVLDIHGKQKQARRTATFFEFSQAATGTLLCTDVAARGLDIPAVDWIVQYDPPDDPKEYIHRVGRTARGEAGKGRALLFLMPEELAFLKYLKPSKVRVPSTGCIAGEGEQVLTVSTAVNSVGARSCCWPQHRGLLGSRGLLSWNMAGHVVLASACRRHDCAYELDTYLSAEMRSCAADSVE
jgi:superfamily II DNA or RNA helicase